MSRTPSKLLTTIYTRYTVNSTQKERIFKNAHVDDVLDYFAHIKNPTLCVDYIGVGGDFSSYKIKSTVVTPTPTVTPSVKVGRGRPKKNT